MLERSPFSSFLAGRAGLGVLLTAAVLYGAAHFSQVMIVRSLGVVPAIWPANAFAIAYVLAKGLNLRERWTFVGALLVGSFLSNTALSLDPWRAFWFSTIHFVSVIGAMEAYWLFSKETPDVRTAKGLTRLAIPTAFLPAIPVAIFGTLVERIWINLDVYSIGMHWVVIHAFNTAIGVIFCFALRRDLLEVTWSPPRLLEAAALVAAAVTIAVFAQLARSAEALFALAPVLAWGAVRYRLGGTTALVMLIGLAGTAVQIWAVLDNAHGSLSSLLAAAHGAQHAPTVNADTARLQDFLLLVCIPVMGLAALAAQHEMSVAEIAAQRSEAQRLSEEKSRLLLTVSHDLRNPLNAVISLSEMMARGMMGPANPVQTESLEAISASGHQMNAMAQQLVDMAKLEAGSLPMDLQPVPLDAAIRRAIANISHHPLAGGIELHFDAETGLAVQADPGRLQQVVENLGSNAVKYGGSGGRVVFAARQVDDGQIRIEVIDFGAGISADKADRVFRPFDRLDAELGKVEGAGVGLAMAKKMTELQGGSMGFSSRPGVETVFWIELPMAA